MKEYYRKEHHKATLKLELAKVGYESKMKELATRLIEEDASHYDSIINSICALRSVIEDMADDARHYKVKYLEEFDKEVAKDARDCE